MAARKWSRIGWAGAAVLAALAVGWALLPKPVPVEVVTVKLDRFQKTIEAESRTRVRDRYVVSAPLAGRLLRLNLKAGDVVTQGATVALIVPSLPSLLDVRTVEELSERVGAAEAELDRAKAAAERARVAHALAGSELARQRELADKGFASRQALDRAERDVELKERELAAARFEEHAAEHQLSVARAAVARARPEADVRGRRGRWTVTAPVGGRVLRVLQESETAVAAGAPLVEIGDPGDLEVIADLLTADAASLQPGAPVTFALGESAPPARGLVRRIEPGAFTKISALGVEEQRVWVVMDFAAPRPVGAALGDGYRVDARIVVDEREQALVVPLAALFRDAAGWAVYVDDGGRARVRRLEVAARGDSMAVIARGIAPGERIVVYPSDALHEGVAIRARENTTADGER